jgi:hypothetical protein
MSKTTKKQIAQGLDWGGRWVDLDKGWGRTAGARFRCMTAYATGLGWRGARIIERTVTERVLKATKIEPRGAK